jgi:hypothetical protein
LNTGLKNVTDILQLTDNRTALEHKVVDTDMRKVYIDSYGVELDFAGFYYHSSKFIPNQNELILTLFWHITPEGKNKVVQTTMYDGSWNEAPYESIYENTGKDIIMTIMRPLKQNVFEKVEQVKLDGIQMVNMEFSKNGRLLGIYDQAR